MKPTSKEIPYQSIDTCSHGFKSLQLAQIIENYTESLKEHTKEMEWKERWLVDKAQNGEIIILSSRNFLTFLWTNRKSPYMEFLWPLKHQPPQSSCMDLMRNSFLMVELGCIKILYVTKTRWTTSDFQKRHITEWQKQCVAALDDSWLTWVYVSTGIPGTGI